MSDKRVCYGIKKADGGYIVEMQDYFTTKSIVCVTWPQVLAVLCEHADEKAWLEIVRNLSAGVVP